MPRPIISPLLSQSFEWNFAVDGGAIGSQATGIIIPNRANICIITGKIITAITDGGGGATIQVGWTGNLAAIFAQAVFPWVTGSIGLFGLAGAASIGSPILFTVAGAPLTAGRMIVNLGYYNLYQ